MGGYTFYFRTAALTSTTEDLGSSFPVEFRSNSWMETTP
jgi:hypothetical protein